MKILVLLGVLGMPTVLGSAVVNNSWLLVDLEWHYSCVTDYTGKPVTDKEARKIGLPEACTPMYAIPKYGWKEK